MRLILGVIACVTTSSFAQVITSNTSFDTFPSQTVAVEVEASRFDAGRFNRYGSWLELPGDLSVFTSTLRISYTPARRFNFGAELPYRVVDYRADLGGSLQNRGTVGEGIFVDLVHHQLRLDAVLRAGFFRAAREPDPVLSVSDGVDRYWLAYSVSHAGRFPASARFEFVYGPSREHDYFAEWLRLAGGRAITPRFDLLLLATYGNTSAGRQEGSFFDSRRGYTADAGAMLQWRIQPSFKLRLSANRTVRVSEGFEGTRITLSAVRAFRCKM